MKDFLAASYHIDWDADSIGSLAKTLLGEGDTEEAFVGRAFRWVRDEIRHSSDHSLNPVTCRASEVLHHRTGFCFAKSHLLAAILRAQGIPAGLCYQRLVSDQSKGSFCLHGLNAVYLVSCGWYRMDPRGNRADIRSDFTPPREQLAFTVSAGGERDLCEIHAEPHPRVLEVLETCETFVEVIECLPDSEPRLSTQREKAPEHMTDA